MPSKTKKQAKAMKAAAHDKSVADKMGVPQSVAREFVAADRKKIITHRPPVKRVRGERGRWK